MEILKLIVYGIVEGITEWLPVSSTGHLLILEAFLPLDASEAFLSVFRIVIQLGAVGAVVVYYFQQLFPWRLERTEQGIRLLSDRKIWRLWGLIVLACVPAALVGLPFDELFERYFYHVPVVAFMLMSFGLLFLLVERKLRQRPARITQMDEMTVSLALAIGLFQVMAAVFPGVSRSGATILGALLLGLSRSLATEFTFFLAVPVMAGASLLKLLKFDGHFSTVEWLQLSLASGVAFLVSLLVIRFLIAYVRKHEFTVFAGYRILLGLSLFLLF